MQRLRKFHEIAQDSSMPPDLPEETHQLYGKNHGHFGRVNSDAPFSYDMSEQMAADTAKEHFAGLSLKFVS